MTWLQWSFRTFQKIIIIIIIIIILIIANMNKKNDSRRWSLGYKAYFFYIIQYFGLGPSSGTSSGTLLLLIIIIIFIIPERRATRAYYYYQIKTTHTLPHMHSLTSSRQCILLREINKQFDWHDQLTHDEPQTQE